MLTTGIFNVITSNKLILLVKRNDVPFWDLPGGTLEKDEDYITCLKREAFEETGLLVSPTKKVGTFYNKQQGDQQIAYCSQIVGGKMIEVGPETNELKFFSIYKLPLNLIPHRRMQIKLALKGLPPLQQNIRDNLLIRLFKHKKSRRLTSTAFFMQWFHR